MFSMVIERLFVLDVQKVSGPTERKVCALGMIKLLTEAKEMMPGGSYADLWYVSDLKQRRHD